MQRDPWYKRLAAWRRRQPWWPTKMISERRADAPYLERISLFKIPGIFQIAIHRFWQSDDDGGLHDHPWLFWGSYILEGGYTEHLSGGISIVRRPGHLRWHGPRHRHRVELSAEGKEVWTLFIMGPKIRAWGFVPNGTEEWIHWRPYLEMRAAEGRAVLAAQTAPEASDQQPTRRAA